ncbi:MAG: VOC family protein [Planctomycetota bacterium]
MTTQPNPRIAWHDLTVPNAEEVRDFYADVVGLRHEPVDMGGYSDFNMIDPGSGDPIGGVCHARGPNAEIPPQWIIYFAVDDLDASLRSTRERGGQVVLGPREMPGYRYAFIRDPAGAVCAVIQAIDA